MSNSIPYHIPVMLNEVIEGLNINPSRTYVDVTFGGGGHSKAILQLLSPKGKLVAFDRDDEAIGNQLSDERITMVNHDYRWLSNFLGYHQAIPCDGILADLGVSSHHFDTPERGFSFRFDAPLDMRMDTASQKTAAQVLNEYSATDLQRIFGQYGEIKNAKTLSQLLVSERAMKPITSTFQLVELAKKCMQKRDKASKYLSQIFQALRIEVNEELQSLELFLAQIPDVLAIGGRVVVITYHSLEDRIVKNFLQTGNLEGDKSTDIFGNRNTPFKIINRKPLTPKEEELEINPRSRSAKLRIAERI